MTSRRRETTAYVPMGQLMPKVHLAGCWSFGREVVMRYRIPSHHLMLIESGRVEAATPGGHLSARARDLLCFRPTEVNEYRNVGPTLFFQIHVAFAAPPRHRHTPLLPGGLALPLRVCLGDYFDEARDAFETCCIAIRRHGPASDVRLAAAVYQLLAVVAELAGPATATVTPARGRPSTAPVAALVRLDRWERARLRLTSVAPRAARVTVRDVAREMGVSVRHFMRLFKAHFGVGAKEAQMSARVQEAARLLRLGGDPVKVVAYRLGFSDSKALARAMKRHLGVRPSDVRLRDESVRYALRAVPAARRPYPVNEHLVPRDSPDDWRQAYRLR